MFQTQNAKENALHRLKIVRGHLEKVMQMVEEDTYCIDVLTQTRALQSALRRVDEVLLEHHLSTCVVDHMKQGHTEHAVAEVMKVFRQKVA